MTNISAIYAIIILKTGMAAFPVGFKILIIAAASAVIVTVIGPYINERFSTIALAS